MHSLRRSFSRSFLMLAVPLVLLAGCHKEEPSRFDEVQARTKNNAPAVAKEAVKGGSFNKFFPKQGDGWDLTFKQEKTGFALANVSKGKKDMAGLSVFDTVSEQETAAKYSKATEKIADYPAIAVGNMGTAILVADRYQVQVRSLNPAFTKADREAWIQKFDLAGIAALK